MKISVITASYNYANYIEETIQSVINQTYSDWELIIVDDGSTDNSVEIINKYCNQDSRIKLYTHQDNENRGLKETLLLGISKAESEWIAFLESDDSWREDYLEKKVEIANRYPEVGLIFNDVEFIGDDNIIKNHKKILKNVIRRTNERTYPCNIFRSFNVKNPILTFSSVMVKKDLLKPEYFNTPVDKLLDWWLYIHIAYDTYVYYVKEPLTIWMIHPQSYIWDKSKSKFKMVQIEAYIDIFKTHPNEKYMWVFILYSIIINIPVKLLVTKTQIIRRFKQYLNMPLKDSPF